MDPELISSLQLVPGLLKLALPKGLLQDSLGLLQTALQPQSSGPGPAHQGMSQGLPAVLLLTPLLLLKHQLQPLTRFVVFVAHENKARQPYSCP